MKRRRHFIQGLVASAVCLAVGVLAALPALSDTIGPINFESYALGTVRGQDAPPWTGADCGATIDQAVVNRAAFPAMPASFGNQSFRLSNAQVSGCFIDAFSPQTANEAGESTAQTSPLSGGTRQPFFDAQFVFASSTGALQPGLHVQVSPDRGDGARMSYVRMEHNATDLEIFFDDVQGLAPGTSQPCTGCANFVETSLGHFDPTVPHTIRITMQFVDGPSNDVVQVFIDGALAHTGGSWEDYYTMDGESAGTPPDYHSRTVDSLLFRASTLAVPAVLGQGFLFDAVTATSGPLPIQVSPNVAVRPVVVSPRFAG